MKKNFLLTWFLALLLTVSYGQWGEEPSAEKPSFKDRIFTGGGFGLSFSNYSDYFSISPIIGYKITPKLAAGVGIQYQYTKYKQYSPSFTTNNYGGSIFARYNFYGPLFLHAEYEYLSYEYFGYAGERLRKGYNSVLAGGGFFQPVGRHAGIFLMALYNFTYKNPTSPYEVLPYNSPWILRAGITAGF